MIELGECIEVAKLFLWVGCGGESFDEIVELALLADVATTVVAAEINVRIGGPVVHRQAAVRQRVTALIVPNTAAKVMSKVHAVSNANRLRSVRAARPASATLARPTLERGPGTELWHRR